MRFFAGWALTHLSLAVLGIGLTLTALAIAGVFSYPPEKVIFHTLSTAGIILPLNIVHTVITSSTR